MQKGRNDEIPKAIGALTAVFYATAVVGMAPIFVMVLGLRNGGPRLDA